MSTFSVSFRIHQDADRQRRYDTFVAQLESVGVGNYWAETTSFYFVKTNETIDAFCYRIYVHSGFDAAKDIYVVMDTEVKSARARGGYPVSGHIEIARAVHHPAITSVGGLRQTAAYFRALATCIAARRSSL